MLRRPLWEAVRAWLRPGARAPDAAPPAEASAVARERLEAVLGMAVGELALYEQALRHRSVLRGRPGSHLLSNERLEFLGDAVLGLAVAERLYEAFPEQNEGFLTRTRAKLVNGPMLADLARALGLPPLILLGEGVAQAEGRENPTILADALEALLGALYLDQGFGAARRFVFRLLEEHVELAEVAEQRSNFKSLLLEHVQARGRTQPAYRVVSEEGPSHDRRFTVEVLVEGRPAGSGRARSKKQAEQIAAEEALARLRQEEAAEGRLPEKP